MNFLKWAYTYEAACCFFQGLCSFLYHCLFLVHFLFNGRIAQTNIRFIRYRNWLHTSWKIHVLLLLKLSFTSSGRSTLQFYVFFDAQLLVPVVFRKQTRFPIFICLSLLGLKGEMLSGFVSLIRNLSFCRCSLFFDWHLAIFVCKNLFFIKSIFFFFLY